MKLTEISVAVLAAALLAGCGKVASRDLTYEVVTRTSCLTTTADDVWIMRENSWMNTGRITEVHFFRDGQRVLFVPGDDFVLFRDIGGAK